MNNLVRVFPIVRELLESLPGRTAVTTDHGNALEGFARLFPIRVYGHPVGIPIPELTELPQFVHQNGERKRVTADPPTESCEETDVDADIAARLRQLSYAE